MDKRRQIIDRIKRNLIIATAALNTTSAIAFASPKPQGSEMKQSVELRKDSRAQSALERPVTDETRQFDDNMASVGSVVGDIVYGADGKTKDQRLKTNIKVSTSQISRVVEERTFENLSELGNCQYLAYAKQDTIHLAQFVLSDNLKEQLVQQIQKGNVNDFMTEKYVPLNNPVYQMAMQNHELVHALHYKKNLFETQESPGSYMEVERNWVTEKTAHFAFTATLVNCYFQLKKQGISNIQYNDGLTMSVEECLNGVRGLKEVVTEKGFDLNKKESLIKLAQCSSADWNATYKNSYEKGQFKKVAQGNFCTADIMDQIQIARDQNNRLDKMCEGLPIGYNIMLDIPQEVRHLMFPRAQEVSQVVENASQADELCFSLSKDGLLAIDAYMNKQGLKNDKEKAAWLKQEFSQIVNRSENADKTLEFLFLSAGRDKNVCYTDNMQTNYAVTADGKPDMAQAEVFRVNDEGELTSLGQVAFVSREKTSTYTLSPKDISAFMMAQKGR